MKQPPEPRRPEPGRPEPEQRYLQQKEAEQLARSQRSLAVEKAMQVVYFLTGSLEVLLALRFFLRLMGANPENAFAGAIYGISAPFVNPLSTLFISPTANGSTNIFDVNVLVAMIAYLILMMLVIWLIQIIGDR
ncbi:MAG: YggT family protein [Spirulinaceae cyanobacterium]